HLVYVHDHRKSPPPTFADAEAQVRQEWESDKRKQLNEQFVDSLIARYDVTIEEVAVDKKPGEQKEEAK
ncbi:MAG: hypothetical protein JRD84_09780, partial [Deltaproteobacteria bacterium]|nr:hypothetical protein [Deltaproteobacteria bacterium]